METLVKVDLLNIVREYYFADLEKNVYKFNKCGAKTHPCHTPFLLILEINSYWRFLSVEQLESKCKVVGVGVCMRACAHMLMLILNVSYF